MADSGNLGQLQTQEWKHLQELADQLEEALSTAESADLTRLLPSPGTPRRLVYLHELIKTEMEIRCRRSKTIALEEYLQRYPELGSADTLPADLIYEEYRVRHRYGDKTPLDSYRQRFPKQFDQLKKLEKQDPVATVYNTATPGTVSSLTPPYAAPQSNPSSATPVPDTKAPTTKTNQAPSRPTDAQQPARKTGASAAQVLPPGEGYQLLECIGKGQFGEVYRALAPGGVVVAVKRVLRSMNDESSQRELKAMQRLRELRHPFLLQTHNYYAFEDRLVIVMELADGSLQERFKACRAAGQTGVPLEEMLAYFREAAEALDYLRDQKLTHRDIKPQNLLLLKGHAKLADFGIARQQESDVDHTMNIGGTPAYMPPEMWSGDISIHSDQYSLAVTWYEMRTGRRVFDGKTPGMLVQQHLAGKPDVSGVPEAEQKVLLRALAKKPDERYSSCKDYVHALAAASAPKPVAPPASRRVMAALFAVAFTITLSILAAVLWKSFFGVRVDWQPQGWTPMTKEVEKDLDGGTYYRRLMKDVNGHQVVMVLVKKEKATDPNSFYIMENKVSNELFAQFASDPKGRSELQTYGLANPGTVKELWKKGGWAPGSGRLELGVDGEQARVPVLGVTVTEAFLFARWLGGKLPTKKHWVKAAGGSLEEVSPDEDRAGPFTGERDDPAELTVDLGATGPKPVGESKRDVSRFGCHDMAGNGYEWTRDLQNTTEKFPLDLSLRDTAQMILMGQDYLESAPLTFKEMRKPKAQKYLDTTPSISFRVVLERE